MINLEKIHDQFAPVSGSAMALSPLEKYAAWELIKHEHRIQSISIYFYIGMTSPASMPKEWWEVDCHFLGFLTDRKCRILRQESKDFLERFILGEKYKNYRRSLKTRHNPIKN